MPSAERLITIAVSDKFLDSAPDAEFVVAVLNILWKVRLVEDSLKQESIKETSQ